jgi:hypothetical protein
MTCEEINCTAPSYMSIADMSEIKTGGRGGGHNVEMKLKGLNIIDVKMCNKNAQLSKTCL